MSFTLSLTDTKHPASNESFVLFVFFFLQQKLTILIDYIDLIIYIDFLILF